MVQLLEDRAERGLDVGEVHDPPGMFAEFTGDVDLDAKGVAMQARSLVPFRNIRQPVGGLNRETFEDVHSAILLRHATASTLTTHSSHGSAKTNRGLLHEFMSPSMNS